ncbi:MAG: DUF4363 family protein [Oscillospiraceae bacterium]|nr:DUF4363 family protein [Oscillospiraceae bacterium]
MKRLAVSIAIISAIVILESWGLFWVRDYTADLSSQLTALSQQLDHPEEVLEQLDRIEEQWHENRKLMSLFIHEKVMDDFEENAAEARLRLQTGEPEAALRLQMAAEAAKEIWEREKPSLQNVL